jgi:thymidylate synthase
MRFKTGDGFITWLRQDIQKWNSYDRKTSARNEDYKKSLIEKIQFFYTIDDATAVILSSSILKQHAFWSISEFLTEIFYQTQPIMYKYKPEIIEWSYKLRNDKTPEYSYGHRWSEYNQISNVVETLSHRLDSKRAVIDIFVPYDTDPKRNDVPCTLMYTFKIRSNKLNMTTFFRSHDIFSGLKYDFLLSSFINQIMCMSINARRKELKLSNENVQPGSLAFYEDSLHVYNLKDKTKMKKFINENHEVSEERFNIMYNYDTVKGMYDDLWYIMKAETSSYYGNFKFALEKINKIENVTFKDMAKMYYNRNLKHNYKKKHQYDLTSYLDYETKIFKW